MKWWWCLILVTVGLSAGCTWAGAGSQTGPVWTRGIESDIVAVHKFFDDTPWLLFSSDGTGRVDGVKITVYLEGAGKGKGVFGSGTIIVTMYRIARDAQGAEIVKPIHTWEMDAERAYVWRAKHETALGWGYGLRMQWPSDLDVAGQEVAFDVKYERESGQVIASRPQRFLVPSIGSPDPFRRRAANVN